MFTAPRDAFERMWRAAFVCVGLLLIAMALPLSMGSTGCSTASARKGPGEPCTRSSECEASLACAVGICRSDVDAGPSVPDAGAGDAGAGDAGTGSVDTGTVDAGPVDAGVLDAGTDDAGASLGDDAGA